MRVLVTAASRYGATEGIAHAIGEALVASGHRVTVSTPETVEALPEFDAVVLGSAVYTGHWLAPALDLARRIHAELPGCPVWLFSSGPVGDPSRKLVQRMGADPVDLPKLMDLTQPRGHKMFPGKLDRHNLRLAQRVGLFFFRGIEGDFRDWDAIHDWSRTIAAQLSPVGRPQR